MVIGLVDPVIDVFCCWYFVADLSDGGAEHFASTVSEIKMR